MPTMQDAATRAAMLARVDTLSPDSAGRWGRMSVVQMLAHMASSLEMSIGILPVQPRRVPLIRSFPLKQLVIHVLPFPKGTPTAPELIARNPDGFAAEVARVKRLVGQLGELRPDAPRPDHPLFGRMTSAEWGVLGYRHFDHHLRQFGA